MSIVHSSICSHATYTDFHQSNSIGVGNVKEIIHFNKSTSVENLLPRITADTVRASPPRGAVQSRTYATCQLNIGSSKCVDRNPTVTSNITRWISVQPTSSCPFSSSTQLHSKDGHSCVHFERKRVRRGNFCCIFLDTNGCTIFHAFKRDSCQRIPTRLDTER